jgi:hypothetical protein
VDGGSGRLRVGGAGVAGEDGEELSHPLLLAADDLPGRDVVGADLRVGVDERAAAVVGVPPLERVEDDEGAAPGVGFLGEPREEPVLPAGAPPGEVLRDESVLGAEPVVERLLGGAGLEGDEVDADGTDAARGEQRAGGVEEAVARRGELGLGEDGGGDVGRGAHGCSLKRVLRVYRPVWLLRGMRIHLVAAIGLVVFWSSGFIGADLGTRDASTTTLLAWRYVVATGLAGVEPLDVVLPDRHAQFLHNQ